MIPKKCRKQGQHDKMCHSDPTYFLALEESKIFYKKEKIVEIRSRIYNSIMYVTMSGELDESNASYSKATLDDLFSGENFNQVIIDLSELSFMDSTGVGILIGRYKRLKQKNIPIYICNPSKHAEKIFNMTGLYNIMPKIN